MEKSETKTMYTFEDRLVVKLIGKSSLHKELVWDLLGLKPYESTPTAQEIQIYEEKCEILKKEQQQTIEELKDYIEKTRSL